MRFDYKNSIQEKSSIGCKIIMKDGIVKGKLHWQYSKSGVCTAELYAFGSEPQKAKAGGYGYDKLTACLRNMTFNSIKLFDHCGQDEQTKLILEQYHDNFITFDEAKEQASKIGASFANYQYNETDSTKDKYASLYYKTGLEILEAYGYTILQVL